MQPEARIAARGREKRSTTVQAARRQLVFVLVALAAEGTSVIYNIGQIERGYERIDERLRALGAEIERRDD